ncbi:hypothetical protein GCM10007962_23940 [Yeosuana aromativorans]|uniref:BioF2-like acetyltransferase domain-containing protein n=1 Tax=Yeosuana aromativorans TaxID=288019 RepID=A0A8J3BQK2_9FLAO|nr:hypothetical protein GCM10007962_23940 [Yeosuana aromativorans]
MENNPFLSKTYVSTWLRHFNDSNPSISFDFIKNITFIKDKKFPIYFNTGKNQTNGLSYSLNILEAANFNNKVLLIMDVPDYIETSPIINTSLKLKKVRQYKGYLANLKGFSNYEAYIGRNFSSKSRSRILKYKKKLECCFNIKYETYFGENITKYEYEHIFQRFKELLKKQEDDKQIINQALFPKNWEYLYELIFPMILKKKAALIVIYDDNVPISITLSYVGKNIFSNSLMTFDSDYSKFHVGLIDIIMRFQFCIKEKINLCDFSKGDHDYKIRWGNTIYNFEYHIIYNSKSIVSLITASIVIFKFRIIQFLRDINIHTLFHKTIYFLKGHNNHINKTETYKITALNEVDNNLKLNEIDFRNPRYSFLKGTIYDFLYTSSESINDIKVLSVNDNLKETFLIIGKHRKGKIVSKNIE